MPARNMIDDVRQDLRYAARTLRRDAAFTVFAIVIITLGIGASGASSGQVQSRIVLETLQLALAGIVIGTVRLVHGPRARRIPIRCDRG